MSHLRRRRLWKTHRCQPSLSRRTSEPLRSGGAWDGSTGSTHAGGNRAYFFSRVNRQCTRSRRVRKGLPKGNRRFAPLRIGRLPIGQVALVTGAPRGLVCRRRRSGRSIAPRVRSFNLMLLLYWWFPRVSLRIPFQCEVRFSIGHESCSVPRKSE